MRALLDVFLEICLLRRGPQDLPASPALTVLSLAAYGLSGMVAVIAIMPLSMALPQTLLDLALVSGLSYLLLSLRGFGARFLQTLTALAGTGTLLNLVAWPLFMWMGQEADTAGQGSPLPSLLFLVLLGWSIAIMAHIVRHALSSTRSMGLLCAMAYLIISLAMASWLLPHQGA